MKNEAGVPPVYLVSGLIAIGASYAWLYANIATVFEAQGRETFPLALVVCFCFHITSAVFILFLEKNFRAAIPKKPVIKNNEQQN